MQYKCYENFVTTASYHDYIQYLILLARMVFWLPIGMGLCPVQVPQFPSSSYGKEEVSILILYLYLALVLGSLTSSQVFKLIRNNTISIVIKDCSNNQDGWLTITIVAGCRVVPSREWCIIINEMSTNRSVRVRFFQSHSRVLDSPWVSKLWVSTASNSLLLITI